MAKKPTPPPPAEIVEVAAKPAKSKEKKTVVATTDEAVQTAVVAAPATKTRAKAKQGKAAATDAEIPETPAPAKRAKTKSATHKSPLLSVTEHESDVRPTILPDILPKSTITPESPPVIKDLPESLAFLSQISPVALHFDKGTELYTAGEVAVRVFFVKKGRFSVIMPHGIASGITIHEVGTGEMCIMSATAALSGGAHTVTATLTEPSDILAITSEQFQELLGGSRELQALFYRQMAERLTNSVLLLEEVAVRRSDVRLAKKICRWITLENRTCIRTATELAEEAGLDRNIAVLLLKEFQRQGLLTYSAQGIMVTDRAALIRKSMEL